MSNKQSHNNPHSHHESAQETNIKIDSPNCTVKQNSNNKQNLSADTSVVVNGSGRKTNHDQNNHHHHHHHHQATLETLNLTHHNILNGYEVKFDDPNWMKSLSSLKPLVHNTNRIDVYNHKKTRF